MNHNAAPPFSKTEVQIARFADSLRNNPEAMMAVYGILGTTAIGGAVEINYHDVWGSGKQETITHDQFTSFTELQEPQEQNNIAEETAILHNYSNFSESVSAMKNGGGTKIGQGEHSSVFMVQQDGKDYVVRSPQPRFKPAQRVVHEHVASGVMASGIPGHERFVAASFAENVVVSERVKGTHLDAMSPEDISGITDEQMDSLISNRIAGSAKGIKYDHVIGNLLYDKNDGFTEIDYGMGGDSLDKVSTMIGVAETLDLSAQIVYATPNGEDVSNLLASKLAIEQRLDKYVQTHYGPEDQATINRAVLLARIQAQAAVKAILGK